MMTTTTTAGATTKTVQVHRIYIKASAQAVWDAITSPEWNRRYAYKVPGEYDLRPGGAYRVISTPEMRNMGVPELFIEGEVLELDPPHRLVQTWHAFFSAETAAEAPGRLTWDVFEEDGGLTRLTVTHELVDSPVTLAAVSNDAKLVEGGGGWAWILSDLKSVLESGSSSFG
jgi:uncharacterized protein YndB with AHSA1/START domain